MNQIATKLFGPLLIAALLQPAAGFAQQTTESPAPPSQVTKPELPESPGSTQTPGPSSGPPIVAPSPETTPAPPTGTAAAPAVQVTGNPVSRPAGAAVAPPKQRRVRSLLIKTGVILGAGVALGTVAALTFSSPGRVPGSR